MASVLRSVLVLAFASCLVVLSAPGCSQQGEGQRCDWTKEGNTDCESGLSCVRKAELLEKITDRCCPPEGQESTERCTRVGKGSNTAGTSNGGSSGSSSSGGAGESAGGAADGGTAGAGGAVGQAGEPSLGGMTSEGGAPGVAGVPSVAGAPVSSAGQGGGAP